MARVRFATWRAAVFILGAAVAGGSGTVLMTWLFSGGLHDLWRENNLATVIVDGLVFVVGAGLLVRAIKPSQDKDRRLAGRRDLPSS
jgi:hypothetical protein